MTKDKAYHPPVSMFPMSGFPQTIASTGEGNLGQPNWGKKLFFWLSKWHNERKGGLVGRGQ